MGVRSVNAQLADYQANSAAVRAERYKLPYLEKGVVARAAPVSIAYYYRKQASIVLFSGRRCGVSRACSASDDRAVFTPLVTQRPAPDGDDLELRSPSDPHTSASGLLGNLGRGLWQGAEHAGGCQNLRVDYTGPRVCGQISG